MSDKQIYEIAKRRLAEMQAAIGELVEQDVEIPSEAYELTHVYEAAIRWYQRIHPDAPA